MMRIASIFIVVLLLIPVLPLSSASSITKSDYESENSGLMDSPWPMLRHDVHHTGRSPYGKNGCTGILKWKLKIGECCIFSSPVIDQDGTIYIGVGKTFYAIYPNGTIKWKIKLGGNVDFSAAISKDGTIYVPADDWSLYAITLNGAIKWRCRLGDAPSGDPLVDKNGIIYIGTLDPLVANGKFHAIYPNGTIKWSINLDGCSSAVIYSDTIYVDCCREGRLYAICADNGTIKWDKWEGTVNKLSSGPSVDENGTIYYGSYGNGYLYAFYPNGTLKWKYKIGATHMSPIISENGTLYIATYKEHNDYLYAFNSDGTLLWKCKVPATIGLMVDKNGIIYGCGIYCIYAVNPNGTIRWKWKINDYVLTHPAMGRDGTIYVAAWDGYLYAIEPRDAADLRIGDVYFGPTWGCIKFKLRNVGCEPAYNVSCKVKISMMTWRDDAETKIYETTVPFIDVGQEIEVKIRGIHASPLRYVPFSDYTIWGTLFGGNSIDLLWVEAGNANGDMCWEGGDYIGVTIIGSLVCPVGLQYWIGYVLMHGSLPDYS